MNSKEREIYDKYAYTELSYIFIVYIEFERRANHTEEEFDGLKLGECKFDYSSWGNRLGITKKRMEKAIKNLSTEHDAIKQVEQGKRGRQSKYFLTRYEEKKKENNTENERRRINPVIPMVIEIEGEQREKKKEKKKEQSSIYNNLNIESNNIIVQQVEQLWRLYPCKTGKAKVINKIPRIIKEEGYAQLERCIQRYISHVENRRNKGFKDLSYQNGSTFFNTGYVDYLDKNYTEAIKDNTKVLKNEKPKPKKLRGWG